MLFHSLILSGGPTLKKVLSYLKPIKGTAVAAMILVVFAQAATLSFPLLMSRIINAGIQTGNLEYIKRVGLIMIAVAFLGLIISSLSSYFSSISSSFASYCSLPATKLEAWSAPSTIIISLSLLAQASKRR